jgi:hypothetical protein
MGYLALAEELDCRQINMPHDFFDLILYKYWTQACSL